MWQLVVAVVGHKLWGDVAVWCCSWQHSVWSGRQLLVLNSRKTPFCAIHAKKAFTMTLSRLFRSRQHQNGESIDTELGQTVEEQLHGYPAAAAFIASGPDRSL